MLEIRSAICCVRAFAVKQLKQLPLLRSEAQIDVAPRHFREHDALALLDVFLGDDAGIQLGEAALRVVRRKIGQRYLESFEDIHFEVIWIGEANGGEHSRPEVRRRPCSRATISMVPLEGSTTGLICVMAAV